MQLDAVQYREALVSFIQSQSPDCFVTLAFNQVVPKERARKRLKEWQARIDRALLGPKWQTHSDRIKFLAILEKPEVNPHWHLTVCLNGALSSKFYAAAETEWKSVVPRGTVKCIPISNARRVAEYNTKDLMTVSKAAESFVLSSEFWTD